MPIDLSADPELYSMILVWDSMFFWQWLNVSDDQPRAIVHESGWSVMPVVGRASRNTLATT